MSEKLASAEIDESRERFEKAAKPYFNNGESFCPWDEDHYADDIAEGMWQMHLAAERDTRERIAQLHTSIIEWLKDATRDAEKCVNPGMRLHGYAGAKVLIEHLERIRGVNR